MTILAGDIKLVASQVMADVPSGGGAPTPTIIADAAQNAIFPDISELDRAGGRVNMRKVFAHVQTANVDGFFGANVIVAEGPTDPNVSVTIFTTEDTFDQRSTAANRVEAYLNAGPEGPWFLYENHITGQRAIQLMCRTNVEPPPVGRTLLLRKREGYGDQAEQYVRLTRVQYEERTYSYAVGAEYVDYVAKVITCDISDALRYDFPGTAANRSFARGSDKTITRDTVVADAATYYGVTPLDVAITTGDAVAMVESVYSQLVPSAQTETSILDQRHSTAYLHTLATSPREVVVGGAPFSQRVRIGQENRGYNYVTIVSPLPAPGSVRVTFRALGNNYSLSDDGLGNLTGSGSGTVNYLTGSISVTLEALPDDRSAVMFYWGPKTAYTDRSGATGYRMPEFVFDLAHTGVTPGSVSITWTSGGVGKTATANSAGVISGDATGNVVHMTGLVHLRPTAMIDPGGQFQIDYTWATVVEEAKTGLTPDGTGTVAFTTTNEPTPGTLEVQWMVARETSESSGVTSSRGNATKASGSATSVAMVDTTKTYPTWTSDVSAAYSAPVEEVTVQNLHPGAPTYQYFADGAYVVTTRSPVVSTSSFSSSDSSMYSETSSQSSKASVTVAKLVTDDGAGAFFGAMGTANYVGKSYTLKVQGDWTETAFSSNFEDASTFESLNATSEPTATVGGGTPPTTTEGGGGSTSAKGGSFGSEAQKEVFGTNSLVVRYKTGSPTPTAHSENYTPPGVTIDLCPYTTDIIVPGSVKFTWMGTVYEDYEGILYRGRTVGDPGIVSGVVNYTSGVVGMSDYVVSGSPTALTVQSLWTRKAREHIANVTFSTSLAPIKPTGLTVSVLDVEGVQLLSTANLAGEVTGPHTHGKIDYESGLVEMQFGDYVLDSGLTADEKAQWWYDADNVRTSDGKIWRPWPVDPETLRYSAVAYFYLPLDASILGLDPVRLPQDGRVPIFRPGGFAVVGHAATMAPATVTNAQVVNCGRVRLSRVRVIGNDGLVINTGYTADLEAGTVTFVDVSGYSQPVTVEHRIEDMAMVAEVQINGRLSFTRQISHDYPVPGSAVSSAMVVGDMQTYVPTLFDQATWTSVWSDAQIGGAATGTFNAISYPIELTNTGTVTERWLIQFTNTTTFQVIGEHVGVIATGNTSTDCEPTNPATGTPYFSIPALGWGGGWSIGNCLRFNTAGTIAPIWVVRTIQQGPETVDQDEFTLLIRGDVDHP